MLCVAGQAAEPFIGRRSCGTATCHGGLVDRGPAWHSSDSRWQANDPHFLAGTVLLSSVSKRIVLSLEPQAADSPQKFDEVLKDRCVSCHAPAAIEWPSDRESVASNPASDLRQILADGVSCEACHGAAGKWLHEHTLVDWSQRDRYSAEYGMKDTKSLKPRTETCASCHVGERNNAGLVRDMNHDMIAAGHPALYFNMWQAQQRLPPHWDQAREQLASAPNHETAAIYDELRQYVLASATRLSVERAQASESGDVTAAAPELSEFDCGACHHALSSQSPRLSRNSHNQPLWQPWYTTGQMPVGQREKLHMKEPELPKKLNAIKQNLQQDSNSNPRTTQDLNRALDEALHSEQLDNRFDYNALPAWLDHIEALLSRLPEGQQPPAELLLKIRLQRTLGQAPHSAATQVQGPAALEHLMPHPWRIEDAEQLRGQLRQVIADASRGVNQ